MAKAGPPLTKEEVLAKLDVDIETGIARWLGSGNGWWIGRIAGTVVTGGYISVQINGFSYRLHHLIWVVATGRWPTSDLDHKDRVPANNAFTNLRLATPHQNSTNQKLRATNKAGYRGVQMRTTRTGKIRYDAVLHKQNGRVILGNFDDPIEAARVWDAAALEALGEYAVLNFPGEYTCNKNQTV